MAVAWDLVVWERVAAASINSVLFMGHPIGGLKSG